MSLKVRLTLFYTMITGGLILLLGAAIYGLVTITLVSQIDEDLEDAWRIIQDVTRVSSKGELENLRPFTLDQNLFVQIWSSTGELKKSSFSVNLLDEPLDSEYMQTLVPIFGDNLVDGVHLRVLSVPLIVGDRPYATLQIAKDMGNIDRTQEDLLNLIGMSIIIGIAIAAGLTWVTTDSALASLENARNAALLIMQTNDLTRRIPQTNPTGDEVDQLVIAFNQNLSRIERLLETQRRFIADVGHELRTPLTVIKGNVGLMRRMGEYDDESLVGISDEVDRLTRLVGDLILLAQAEAGKLPIGWDPVDLDSVVLEVYRQMLILANSKSVELHLDHVEPVRICGDRDRLTQVLVNLISNGIKYTPSGGVVRLSIRNKDNKAVVDIKDNGPGIPKSDLPYIFERFYRAEKSRQRSKDGKGFGLGLSIAYYIVNGHNGAIEVDSEEGQGTTFRVVLPVEEAGCIAVEDELSQ